MKNRYTLLPLLALITCSLFTSRLLGDPGNFPKEIEKQIQQVENSLSGHIKFEGISGDNLLDRMAFYKVKGLSIAVIKDYKIIWTKGYGWADEGERQPVTEETMFQAASVSKSINSMGIMKLVQDKKLDLNKDINDYLISWKFPYENISNRKKITTLNLLTHTAGLNDGAAMYIDKDTIPTLIQVLNGAKASRYVYSDAPPVRSLIDPNLRFQYSNNGVGITQLIINDITQKPYEQYMQETVFTPLGMTNSCYTEMSLNRYKGHVATGYTGGYEVPGKHVIVPMQAAGGLWTTPTDLARFIIDVQLSFLGRSNKILSRETTKTMLTPYIQTAPGFFLVQRKPGVQKYFSHSGIIRGFKSEYFGSFEGGYGVVVMINSDGNSGNIVPEVVNSVATVYKWKDFYEPEIRKKPVTVPAELLAKCEGVYLYDDKYAVILKKSDGGHYYTDGKDSKMHFTSGKDFFNIEFQSNKELIIDGAGNVTGLRRFLNGEELATAIKVTNIDSLQLKSWQLAEIAWHLLENKRYIQASVYFKRVQAIDPTDMMTKCNLAHCYLFSKDYNKALKLYRDILERDNTHTFGQTIQHDFAFFKSNGFDTPLMDNAIAELKLKKTKAYN